MRKWSSRRYRELQLYLNCILRLFMSDLHTQRVFKGCMRCLCNGSASLFLPVIHYVIVKWQLTWINIFLAGKVLSSLQTRHLQQWAWVHWSFITFRLILGLFVSICRAKLIITFINSIFPPTFDCNLLSASMRAELYYRIISFCDVWLKSEKFSHK